MDYDFELIICLRDLLACLPNPVYLNLRSTPKQPTCAYGDFRGPPPKRRVLLAETSNDPLSLVGFSLRFDLIIHNFPNLLVQRHQD